MPQPPPHYTTDHHLRSVSPRRQNHHDNSCHDDGRPPPPGQLVRSRSDETLANVSVFPRQRRPSSARRRKKTTAATTDRLITDFNEGKEVDLDTLTARGAAFDSAVDRNSKPAENNVFSTRANVRNWLRTQNDGGSMSKWTAPASKHHSLDVHHL